VLHVGCWKGTPDTLRTIVQGTDWPDTTDPAEQDRRRPGLLTFADLAEEHIAANPDVVPDLAERWQAGDAS